MNHRFLRIHPNDTVLVALGHLQKGTTLSDGEATIVLQESIEIKHKFAAQDHAAGNEVILYGIVVGKATQSIAKGSALTVDNVAHQTSGFSEKKENFRWNAPDISAWKNKTFMGYYRSDGQVGTANYWLVVPLVFCENRNVEVMRQAFLEELGYDTTNPYKQYVRQMTQLLADGREKEIKSLAIPSETFEKTPLFPQVDGIQFLTHQSGCGGTRQDSEMLCALIAGYLNNPNVGGATILSLGCQNAQVSLLMEKLEALDPNFQKPLYILEQQKQGSEQQLLTSALQQTFLGLAEINKLERSPAPLNKLTIGLECGGSDGFSGISANPAVGYVSDLIVALGGTALLSEFPELCGVEQELINRCAQPKIADKFIRLMRDYEASAHAAGSGFDMNPSPGNIKDGLITDAMKSAGAAKKGGTSPVTYVLDYAEYSKNPGLNLLCTPGNDVESTTALAGSGANLILFTTGLGTPTGNPIAPVVKISSNTVLAERMPDIIDLDAGSIIIGKKTIEQMGEDFLNFVIAVASGEIKTKAQLLQQNDFIPWKRGVSL